MMSGLDDVEYGQKYSLLRKPYRQKGSAALYTGYTVYTVDTVDMVYTIDTVDNVYTVDTEEFVSSMSGDEKRVIALKLLRPSRV